MEWEANTKIGKQINLTVLQSFIKLRLVSARIAYVSSHEEVCQKTARLAGWVETLHSAIPTLPPVSVIR